MTPKTIFNIFAAVLFLFVSSKEIPAQALNKPNNEPSLAYDIQLLLSLHGFSGRLDGRCGPTTKAAIKAYLGTPSYISSDIACNEDVKKAIIDNISLAITMSKQLNDAQLDGARLTKEYLESLSFKIDAIRSSTESANNKLDIINNEMKKLSTIKEGAGEPKNEDYIKYIVLAVFVIVIAAAGVYYFRNSDIYWLGAPRNEEHRRKFIDDLSLRFNKKEEDAVQYISNITDRIIAKAVGLLQYNAVLLAVTYLISYNVINCADNKSNKMLDISIFLSILSTLFMMVIMFTHWHKDYKSPE
ncbi:MAG: hypothetical protein ACR65T_12090 [Methylocystis sp.]|uniref:hypothetical protein n=1 Tax=Methylocystis sp. TaxID=1911079 RepID=UPI003DA6343A